MAQSPVKRFWNLLKIYKSEIKQIYFYAILIGVVNLTLPLGIQAIINFLQTGMISSSWFLLIFFVLGGIAITGILQVLQLRIVENIQQDLYARSAFEFAYRIPKISLLSLDKIHVPELANRFFDTLTVQKGMPKILLDFSLSAFQIIFGLILLTIYSPFFIMLGIVLVIILWLIFRITGPRGLSTSLEESKYKYKMAHWLEEIARANRSFKVNPANRFHLNKTDNSALNYIDARERHFKVLLGQFRLFIGFKVLVAASLLILGGVLVFNEQMDIGQFVAAEIIIILIINSVEKLLRIFETSYDVLTALDKIGFVSDMQMDENKGKNITTDKENGFSVRAVDLNFGFPESDKTIINNLSFEIKSNERIYLTGPSGSGKSLLLQIIAGLYTPDSGKLLINNTQLQYYNKEHIWERVGSGFAENQIFEGTFKENILMGRQVPANDLDEVISVLKLDEFFAGRPNGIDCMVDSGGRRLPRSIVQKLHIARLIVAKPQLLLLEEPLHFIDNDEKRRIIDYLTDDIHKWTLIVVSDFKYWRFKCSRTLKLKKEAF
jgi:ABC-type bacteriocin/lantibiotic exporter with double-glycine peptidase domain